MEERVSTKKIVISLGGSIIIPDSIDSNLLVDFRDLIVSYVEKGFQFYIITGGGGVCRKYQKALEDISNSDQETLDWMGIYTTHLNARFMKFVFGEYADDIIATEKNMLGNVEKSVVLLGGWVPGHSSDFGAVEIADMVGAEYVLNLSNISHVYSEDPKNNPKAQKLNKLDWPSYMDLIPEKWSPGLNSPFDPMAARIAERCGIKVVIMDGRDISNISKYLEGKEFEGTILS